MRDVAAILLVVGLASPAVAAGLDSAGARLHTEVLRPLYAEYADRARGLATVTPDCAGEWREVMHPAYIESVLAWRRLEAAGAGTAVAGDTPSTIYFWPDKHGTGGRQLTAALHRRDPALTRPADLSAKSVGLQSLATLEVLLFGETVPRESREFACRYALAIAAFQGELAVGIAGKESGEPVNDALLGETMFRGMLGTLDVLIALELERPLGTDLAAARGERARAWRSGLSLPLIAAALDTVAQVYTTPGAFSTLIQSSAELSAFDAVLRERFQTARAAMDEIGAPINLAVSDPTARPAVERLLEELRGVRRLLTERLAPALGLASGFNALDGD